MKHYTQPIITIAQMEQDVIRMSYALDVYDQLFPTSTGGEDANV